MDRLKAALALIGAVFETHNWAIGVDVVKFRVGGEELVLFSDTWSIDVEGPEQVAARLVSLVKRQP